MSPTIHREKGFEFRVYYNDHEPAHVHAIKSSRECKIGLDPVEVLDNKGLKPAEIKRALQIVAANLDKITSKWNEIFPP